MKTEIMDGQVSLFDQGSQFTKMSLELFPRTAAETSKPSSQNSSKSQTPNLPMCLCLKAESGARQDASTMSWEDGALLGEYTMDSFGERPNTLTEEQSFSELPNGVSVSRLSLILVDDAPQKYCLSAKACQGILNRAERRGKALPAELKEALEQQVKNEADNELYPQD